MNGDHVAVEPVAIPAEEREEILTGIYEPNPDRAIVGADDVPFVLLPYQARWNADLAAVRVGEKSRRIGYSWGCFAAEGVLEAMRARGGMNQYYMGYNLGMAVENIADARRFAEAYGVMSRQIEVSRERETIVRPDGVLTQTVTRMRLVFATGYVYEALSSSPWNWRGRQGHARIDEAAFHNNLEEVIKGALAMLMWGGRVSIISTHNSEDSYFFRLIRMIAAGVLRYSLHRVTFDDAIADGFYRRICLKTGREWSAAAERAWRDEQYAMYPDQADADEELGVIAKKGSGRYFSRLLLENAMVDGVPVLRWNAPDDLVTDPDRQRKTREWIADQLRPVLDNLGDKPLAFGQDFGRDRDLSYISLAQEVGAERWTERAQIELRAVPFDCQAMIRDELLALRNLRHAAFDARGNGQSHAEGALQKRGAGVVSCIKATAEWYAEWFPLYRQALERRAYLLGQNEDVIVDHGRVVLVKGRPTMDDGRDKGSDGQGRHGDSAIGSLLGFYATRQGGGPIEWTPAPARGEQFEAFGAQFGGTI